MFYVYLISSDSGQKYIGYTNNLKRRISEHNEENGAKYTKNEKWELIYYEAFKSKSDAIRRENQLKHHGGSKRSLLKRLSDSLRDLK